LHKLFSYPKILQFHPQNLPVFLDTLKQYDQEILQVVFKPYKLRLNPFKIDIFAQINYYQ